MARQKIFIRNLAGRDSIDIFLVSAVSSILFLRFGLFITGYPAVGGSRYHIAHMLWGGLAMLLAFVINFVFLGERVQRVVATLGGVGFGMFLDEVGKFVTRDNNYFFRPAVGIIYAVFVIVYLLTSYLTRKQKLTSFEYQLNALRRFEEAIFNDMDVHERAETRALLALADQKSEITQQFHRLLHELPVTTPPKPRLHIVLRQWLSMQYERLWKTRNSRGLVRAFFVIETIVFISLTLVAVYDNIDAVRDFFAGRLSYGHSLVIGQLGSTVVAGALVIIGLGQLRISRLKALEWFRRSILINLLLTEFFIFSRLQFGALPSFIFNLILFIVMSAALRQEQRQRADANEEQAGETSKV